MGDEQASPPRLDCWCVGKPAAGAADAEPKAEIKAAHKAEQGRAAAAFGPEEWAYVRQRALAALVLWCALAGPGTVVALALAASNPSTRAWLAPRVGAAGFGGGAAPLSTTVCLVYSPCLLLLLLAVDVSIRVQTDKQIISTPYAARVSVWFHFSTFSGFA